MILQTVFLSFNVLLLFVPTHCFAKCRSGHVLSPYSNRCFGYFPNTCLAQTAARAACVSDGGTLVTWLNSSEYSWIFNITNTTRPKPCTLYLSRVWIGVEWNVTQLRWISIADGSDYTTLVSQQGLASMNPDAAIYGIINPEKAMNESVSSIVPNYQMNNVTENITLTYMCSYDGTPSPTTTARTSVPPTRFPSRFPLSSFPTAMPSVTPSTSNVISTASPVPPSTTNIPTVTPTKMTSTRHSSHNPTHTTATNAPSVPSTSIEPTSHPTTQPTTTKNPSVMPSLQPTSSPIQPESQTVLQGRSLVSNLMDMAQLILAAMFIILLGSLVYQSFRIAKLSDDEKALLEGDSILYSALPLIPFAIISSLLTMVIAVSLVFTETSTIGIIFVQIGFSAIIVTEAVLFHAVLRLWKKLSDGSGSSWGFVSTASRLVCFLDGSATLALFVVPTALRPLIFSGFGVFNAGFTGFFFVYFASERCKGSQAMFSVRVNVIQGILDTTTTIGLFCWFMDSSLIIGRSYVPLNIYKLAFLCFAFIFAALVVVTIHSSFNYFMASTENMPTLGSISSFSMASPTDVTGSVESHITISRQTSEQSQVEGTTTTRESDSHSVTGTTARDKSIPSSGMLIGSSPTEKKQAIDIEHDPFAKRVEMMEMKKSEIELQDYYVATPGKNDRDVLETRQSKNMRKNVEIDRKTWNPSGIGSEFSLNYISDDESNVPESFSALADELAQNMKNTHEEQRWRV